MTPAPLLLACGGAGLLTVTALQSISQGLLLGLSSGLTCLASCAPVLLPLLAGNQGGPRRHGALLAEYLAGRLLGYLLFGLLVWLGALLVIGPGRVSPAFRGVLDLLLGGIMIAHGVYQFRKPSAAAAASASSGHSACLVSPWKLRSWLRDCPRLIPAALGLVSGLNLCPPFVVALTQGGLTEQFGGLMLFFAAFFCATSAFFLPLPFLSASFRRFCSEHVACFASCLVGLYMLYTGACHFLLLLAKS